MQSAAQLTLSHVQNNIIIYVQPNDNVIAVLASFEHLISLTNDYVSISNQNRETHLLEALKVVFNFRVL